MKKYTSPECETVLFDGENIIMVSSEVSEEMQASDPWGMDVSW